jgi:hypothetical protein
MFHVEGDPKSSQQMTIADLALKRLSARAIHDDLTATLERDAVACSSVTRYLGEGHPLPSSQDTPEADVHRRIDDADSAVLSPLDENRFAFVREFSRLTHIHPSAIPLQSMAASASIAHALSSSLNRQRHIPTYRACRHCVDRVWRLNTSPDRPARSTNALCAPSRNLRDFQLDELWAPLSIDKSMNQLIYA